MPTVELNISADVAALTNQLYDAFPNKVYIRTLVNDSAITAYLATSAGKTVGAAAIRWGEDPEIELMAVSERQRGKGYGKSMIDEVISLAKERGVSRLLVGTGSLSVGQIIFYQKCGFRISGVRRDYFTEQKPPIVIGGQQLKDMVVFEYIRG